MNKRQIENKSSDCKSLFLNPANSNQKIYEAMRALIVDEEEIEFVANKFGYNVSTLKTLLSKTLNGKIDLFPSTNRKPKKTKIPDKLNSEIISLRNKGMSAQDILKKMNEQGISMSVRTIERKLKEFGFSKLKRRTNEGLGLTKKNTIIPMTSENIDFEKLKPFNLDCPVAGAFFFIPYIIESGLVEILKKIPLPKSSVIGSTEACLSMLFFKLIGGERLSQIQSLDHESGLGVFAGLNVLPKSTYMSTYSCRCSEKMILDLQQEVITHFNNIYPEMYPSNVINLDFHSIPHFGDESEMERVWCGAKGKTMKGANTVVAHDSESNAIMYTRADILRSEESQELKKFIDFWKRIKGSVNETLVFDCKFTTYKVLDEISPDVKFITLRKRNEKLLQRTAEIPESEWTRVHVPIPKRKRKNISIYEERTTLADCTNEFRQIIIKDHGRANPTFIILNDFDMPIKTVLILYAQRWHVEQKIAELVSFFNLNALTSPLMIRIHFDLLWTIISDMLYHIMAKDLRRFEKCLAPSIFKKFINMPGRIQYDGNGFTIKIRKRAHTPILLGLDKLNNEFSIPWLDNKKMKIEWLP